MDVISFISLCVCEIVPLNYLSSTLSLTIKQWDHRFILIWLKVATFLIDQQPYRLVTTLLWQDFSTRYAIISSTIQLAAINMMDSTTQRHTRSQFEVHRTCTTRIPTVQSYITSLALHTQWMGLQILFQEEWLHIIK